MLNLGSDGRLARLDGVLPGQAPHALDARRLLGHGPLHLGERGIAGHLGPLGDAGVARVGVAEPVVRPDQGMRHRNVAHVRGREGGRVHQAAAGVDPDVRLHAEMPVLALVHLRVARARGVLRGGRRLYEGGVHDRAAAHHDALGLEDRVDAREDLGRQAVLLDYAAELQQRRGVGDLVAEPELHAHELGEGPRIVDRVLDALVREVEPELQEVHPEHLLGPHRPAAAPAGVVIGLDRGDELAPGNRLVHALQERLALGRALPGRVLDVGEGGLTVHGMPPVSLL